MIEDCGYDGFDGLLFTFPYCCKKHSVGITDYLHKKMKDETNKIVRVINNEN